MSGTLLMQDNPSAPAWSQPNIGSICRLINGRAYKKNELLDAGKYSVLRVGNFFTSNHWYFSNLELEPEKYCNPGDLLYAWSASFGPRFWAGEKAIFHYHIWKVEPDPAKVIKEFLFYFFEWDKDRIRDEQGAGATMIHVSKSSMEARRIPLPPLNEQEKIVAKLDQAFAALDRARAHAEANIKNTRELFERSLEEVLGRPGPDWKQLPLSSLGAIQTGSTPKTSDAGSYGDFIPFIKPGDFKPDGTIDLENQGLSEAGAKKARIVPSGSALMVCIGATIGKAGFTEAKITTNQQINSIAPRDGVSGEFLYYQFISLNFQRAVLHRSGQATLPIINKSKWSEISVRIPSSMEKQLQIVEDLRRVKRHAEQLLSQYRRKLTDIVTLRQSLLQQAFSGQLT